MLGAISKDNILLVIDSDGGHTAAGLEVYYKLRAMLRQHIQIIGKVDGEAFSASFMVLQGCKHRVATSSSKLMIHDPGFVDRRTPFITHNSRLEDYLRHHEEVFAKLQRDAQHDQKMIEEILLARSSYFHDHEALRAFLDEERVLSAEEALGLGFLDIVV